MPRVCGGPFSLNDCRLLEYLGGRLRIPAGKAALAVKRLWQIMQGSVKCGSFLTSKTDLF
jgi:hypothetical protein